MGTAVVVLGLIVSALPGVNKAAFMSWHTWNPLASSAPPRDLSYVWDQSYKPLHWRGKPTAVLNVWAPHATYWKVATLENFSHGAWTASSYPITTGAFSRPRRIGHRAAARRFRPTRLIPVNTP